MKAGRFKILKQRGIYKRIVALMIMIFMTAGISMAAVASDSIKSQGNIKFENGTEDTSDDVLFYSEDLYYLNHKVEEMIKNVTEGKAKIAEIVKQKGSQVTADSGVPAFDELSDAVRNIGNNGTAGAADVLEGKTVYNGAGYTTGTLPNKSGTSATANVTSSGTTGVVEIQIPANGYYDTSSKLTFNINNIISLDGNADTSAVLSGSTFYSNSLTRQTGSMPNNGAISGTLNCGESKTIPAGYTSGGTITANSLADQTAGNATADNISSGKTAWVNGQLVTGTGKDVSDAIVTPPAITDFQIVKYLNRISGEAGNFTNHLGSMYEKANVTTFQLEPGKTLLKDLMVYPIYAPSINIGISFLLKDGSPMNYDPVTGILSLYSEPFDGFYINEIAVWYSN